MTRIALALLICLPSTAFAEPNRVEPAVEAERGDAATLFRFLSRDERGHQRQPGTEQ